MVQHQLPFIVPKFEKAAEVELAGHKILIVPRSQLGSTSSSSRWTVLSLLSDFEDGVKLKTSSTAGYFLTKKSLPLAELGATRINSMALVKICQLKKNSLEPHSKLLADKKGLEVLIKPTLVMFVISIV